MMTEPAIDPVKRAEVEARIKKITTVSSSPATSLLTLLRVKYHDDMEAQYLMCEAILKIDPNDQDAKEYFQEAKAKLAAQQRNKKSTTPSTPLSTSPNSAGSPNSSDDLSSSPTSGEFVVGADLKAKISTEEKKKKEEFIRDASQSIPEGLARMRSDMLAEVARLDKEMKELPPRRKQAEETIERVNRALKDAKIPEAVELNTMEQKPYKLKKTKTIKYLKGKASLEDLLTQRQHARVTVAECDKTLPDSEKSHDVLEYRCQLLGELKLTTSDYEELYESLKPLLEQYDRNMATASMQEKGQVEDAYETKIAEHKMEFVNQKLAAMHEADLADLAKQRALLVDDIVNGMQEAFAEARKDLRQEINVLKDKVQVLKTKRDAAQDRVQLIEKGLREVGIQPPKSSPPMAQHVNYQWMHQGGGAHAPQPPRPQSDVSQLIANAYSRPASVARK